ncbi:TPA: sensor histidine kinase [Streptococcus equi subsp. zooepidemicus]|nr:sensor histidine kinase [Streptococcus equi subsp. zooepidemicus]
MTSKSLKRFLMEHIKQGFLINRLMKIYSLFIVALFSLSAVGLSTYSIRNTYQMVDNQMQMRLDETLARLQSQNYITLRVLEQLIGRPEDYRNLYQYMILTPNQYFTKVFEDWGEGKNTPLFSEQVRRLFDLYPDLDGLTLMLDDSTSYLYADRSIKTGRLLFGKPQTLKGNYLVRSIRHPESGDVTGQLYLHFTDPGTILQPEQHKYLATFAFDYYGRELFHQGGAAFPELEAGLKKALKADQAIDLTALSKSYHIQYNRSGDLLAYVAVKRSYFMEEAVRTMLLYGLGSLLLAWLLLQLLFREFRNYIKQVSDITDTIEMVAAGDLSLRIDNSHMELELYHISEAINQMLGNINAYIQEIYVLEVEQRDAQMRALQSQINPHFLYNTLEYIRMYALSCQQEELADVIYAFAALLRNNISQDKVTTLKEELVFCEKYIYLYQMRYPDSFAYHVKLDPVVADVEIPKFIIQPLVENYFVHGIDYSRYDNALSIKALDEEDSILIQVLDNGKGISPERLVAIEKGLEEPQSTGNSSIGLQNVYMRLFHQYRDRVTWSMSQAPTGGFRIQIRIRKEA